MWPFKRKWRPHYLDENKFPGAILEWRSHHPAGYSSPEELLENLTPYEQAAAMQAMKRGEWSPGCWQDDGGLLPHQPARHTMWGNLKKEQCALRGLEAVAGMVSTRHTACGHFWCDDTSRTIVVELYYNWLRPTADYIGAFLWAVKDVQDHSDGYGFRFFGEDEPTQKLVIQPLTDGSVFIRKGLITHIPGQNSAAGQGHIDDDTAEELRVFPRQVRNIIADSSAQWPTFSMHRDESENGWHIGRCFGGVNNEWYSTPAFVTLPV